MRLSLLIAIMALFANASFAAAEPQTQGELNRQSCRQLEGLEQKLAALYAQVLAANSADKAFLVRIKKSQQAWIAFHAAELNAIYPAVNKGQEYGSVYPMCRCDELSAMTQARIDQLEEWVNGVDEGDVCVGSRAEKEAGPSS